MKNLFLAAIAVFMLVSCKLTQQYTFNKDFSGHYMLQFDLSDMASYGVENPDSIPDVFEGFNLDSVQQAYAAINGLSKVKVKAEKNVLIVEYNFADLNALNTSLSLQDNSELGMTNNSNVTKFRFEEGIFTYTFSDVQSEVATPDSIAQMMSFVDYNITMEFAKTIDAATNGKIDETGKRINLVGNLGEVASKEKSLNVQVTFK